MRVIHMINGIIFQKKENKKYKGVDGNNWYLNDIYQEFFGEYFDNYIGKSWYDSDYVDVCSEKIFIKSYIALSQKERIKFRMLLCETEKPYPRMESSVYGARFIGYDYAYSGGSYYSAVLNDVCSGRIEEFINIKLNSYGLFNNFQELSEFIKMRNELAAKSKESLFEKGDFLVYKLYEAEPDAFK